MTEHFADRMPQQRVSFSATRFFNTNEKRSINGKHLTNFLPAP